MSAATRTGTAVRSGRAREAAEALGVRAVLLAFWGTPAVLARCCAWFGKRGDESVRHKA
ncbi:MULTISPECIES: hypothetical protein [unclassified Streptomyces]|uniref:hypothetical protein n=1 Tax=unclassified Streptomyces TaxID=2593676 RepID=UPI0036F127EF